MPIPQLNRKGEPSWRNNQKKYFLSRKKNPGVLNLRNNHNNDRKGTSGSGLWKRIRPKLLWGALVLFFLGIIGVVGTVYWVSRDLPDPNRLSDRKISQSTKIYDRTGTQLLYEIHGDEQRTLVNLKDLPPYIKQAAIAIEDKDFYNHAGISIWGIFRGVVWQAVRGKRIQGGSTLTQQFVKNAILTSERTVTRKLKEWILSYKLEKSYTKDEILQMYLNEIPYGSTAYGVEAASQKYFGKAAKDISLAEAATLAAMTQAPSKYSPYGPNRDLLIERRNYVLDLMVQQKYITKDDADIAKGAEVKFVSQGINIKAPHFVMYVKELLSAKYGEKTVEQGGLKIITSLDLYKQDIAEETIKKYVDGNQKKYNASNAALLSIDPKNGQILAMVGSKDYFDDKIDGQVNITLSERQPGSSLKPLVYATAFTKGYTPNTILYDVNTNFSVDPSKPYEPHDYDLRERGPISMRNALDGSLNIPAVKTIYLAGINNVLSVAKDFGYTTLTDPDRYGLSLVLGGGEVKMIEHVSAYGAFAREGILHPAVAVLRVEDKDGKVLEEYKDDSGKQAMDPKVVRMLNNVLSDNNARSFVFGSQNWLNLGSRPVAAKTGTTNDYRDAWTIGFTPSVVTGVWVGNNDNSEMKKGADGSIVAAPIWHDFMQKILGNTPIEQFNPPEIPHTGKAMLDGEVGKPLVVKIDKISGKLATEFTPQDLVVEKTYFEPHSILYYVNKDDPLGDAPKDPNQDPQFALWESRVQLWAAKQIASSSKATSTVFSKDKPPTEKDDIHTAENQPELTIVHPEANQTLLEPELTALVSVSAKRGIDRVEYYINDNLFFTNKTYPYSLRKDVSFLSNGFYSLKVRACDDADNCTESKVEFNLILENNNNTGDVSLNLSVPAIGPSLSSSSFPFLLSFSSNSQPAISKISVYAQEKKQKAPVLIGTVYPADSGGLGFSWTKMPATGSYTLYGEALTWGKKAAVSNEVVVEVGSLKSK